MDFLTENQIVLITSTKYEDIYIRLSEMLDIKYHELFLLCVSIGFKHNRKGEVSGKGREMRSTYFDQSQLATAYTIILNDEVLGMNIERFEEKEFASVAKKTLESYAEGGMDILVENVFGYKFSENILDPRYDEYLVDLLSYVYEEIQEIPF